MLVLYRFVRHILSDEPASFQTDGRHSTDVDQNEPKGRIVIMYILAMYSHF